MCFEKELLWITKFLVHTTKDIYCHFCSQSVGKPPGSVPIHHNFTECGTRTQWLLILNYYYTCCLIHRNKQETFAIVFPKPHFSEIKPFEIFREKELANEFLSWSQDRSMVVEVILVWRWLWKRYHWRLVVCGGCLIVDEAHWGTPDDGQEIKS